MADAEQLSQELDELKQLVQQLKPEEPEEEIQVSKDGLKLGWMNIGSLLMAAGALVYGLYQGLEEKDEQLITQRLDHMETRLTQAHQASEQRLADQITAIAAQSQAALNETKALDARMDVVEKDMPRMYATKMDIAGVTDSRRRGDEWLYNLIVRLSSGARTVLSDSMQPMMSPEPDIPPLPTE